MKIKSTLMILVTAALIPLCVTAKQPVAGGCEILVAAGVNPGNPFTVTVARTPTYPGQWFAPTVSVVITVPVDPGLMPGPNDYSQTVTQTIDGLGGSNDAVATFVIPSFANLVFTDVSILATVTEPLNRNRQFTAAYCEAVTALN